MPTYDAISRQAVIEPQLRLKSISAGTSIETGVTLGTEKNNASFDTGSSVSTMRDQFYRNHLSNLKLETISGILYIQCADGKWELLLVIFGMQYC